MFEAISVARRPNWALRITLAALFFALGAAAVSVWRMIEMPLHSYKGALPPISPAEKDLAARLTTHVNYLSVSIGERNLDRPGSLAAAMDYIRDALAQNGYVVRQQPYTVQGQQVSNVEAELPGTADTSDVVIVGAHYDSVSGTVGANDNASGVAATLELARVLRASHLRHTVRFAFFVNEEPPYFQTDEMGSLVYARKLRENGVHVSAMISLETIGYYSDSVGSQKYPALLSPFYPNRGDFIGFVANPDSRPLVRRAIRTFRQRTNFPSEGIAAPESLPGIGWSDQWSFWRCGYPAIMITDTAAFRYPYYHTTGDTVDKIDFEKAARVVEGAASVVTSLADKP